MTDVTVKSWAEIKPEDQQKFRAYLYSNRTGQEITSMAGGEHIDLDYAIWLIYLELLCWNTCGVSFVDLADYTWRESYDNDLSPGSALALAIRAEGLR